MRLIRASDQRTLVTETTNLSSGGFLVHSQYPFAKGDVLECTFELTKDYGPSPLELRCQACVVRVGRSHGPEAFQIACRVDRHVLSGAIHLKNDGNAQENVW